MAFATAATTAPVPRMLSSGPGAPSVSRLRIAVPAPTPSYPRLSTTALSSSQLALALSILPLTRSNLRPCHLASALQEVPAVGGGESEGSKPSALQEVPAVGGGEAEGSEPSAAEVDGAAGGKNQMPTIYVENLPWDLPAEEIEALFAQCGTVKKVEIMKQRSGRHRGFGFVRMGSEEEARAAIEKFDSYELRERIIRVNYAKNEKRPPRPRAPAPVINGETPAPAISGETRHLIYVSNLAWKARAVHLREFFSASFKPVSARVVFERPNGSSAGYGFVSFATAEEAESAISELNGKELMGRPIRLKISESKGRKPRDKEEEANNTSAVVEV